MQTYKDSNKLRESHFHLGNNNPNPFITQNQVAFSGQPKKQQVLAAQIDQNTPPVLSDKQNLRASHFELGNNGQGGFYNTTYNAKYPHWKNAENAKLSEAQKKDLRTHHFELGGYAPTTLTMNNLNYGQKEVENLQLDMEKCKQKMRGHHHDFKEMPYNYMTTQYNQEYNQPIDTKLLQQSHADEIKEKAAMLRNSHIILGKEQVPYKSTQQGDYTNKGALPEQIKNYDFQASHFQFGIQKDELKTTNNLYHDQQPIIKSQLADDVKKDLRSSHFQLGADYAPYQTEFTNNYKQPQKLEPNIGFFTGGYIFKDHFSIGVENQQSNYQTAYSQNMKPPLISQSQGNRDQKADRGSHFNFGQQGNFYTSEFSSKFKVQNNAQPAQLNEAQKQNIKNSHFQFNDIEKNSYQTSSKTAFITQDINKSKSQLDPQLQKDLRSHHFQFGKDQVSYVSSQKRAFTPKQGGLGQFNASNKADLRAHHFQLG